ncbi:hypothetical protein AXK12_08415 [Cephaloticoccus capnophilus]|uniref:Glycosyl transferase family 1 domain-containing protein n=1 Tax=Cephaloticoccus capnophilus TaxID=1548208 RepID=A0A139SH86_9BACT|nr:glycosyltransferase family 1 protein [Cephaloticoccus capnophilus]KXU33919.1 hypothetical protein AXK12_08415 [Cephaloticoccus capnophilus]
MPGRPKVLRLLVDLEALLPGGSNGGIKPALREQFRWLGAQREQPFEFIYLCRPEVAPELRREWMRPNDRLIFAQEAAPNIAELEHCDLVYSAFGMTRWAYPGIPTVKMEVDVLHRDYPESLSEGERQHRERHFCEAVEKADLFQVNSDYTGQRLGHYYGVEPERIVRTYQPIQHRFTGYAASATGAKRPPAAPYFFYPANAWAHKNHKTLLVAYALYRHEAQCAAEPVWRLVLTGTDDESMRALRALAHTLSLEEHVDFRGFVDEATLSRLWAEAGALVFPSLHEGFGIPLLEAMSLEVPILANRATAIPEVAGDAALLVDARSPEKLACGLRQIANDAPLRAALVERGRARLTHFSLPNDFGPLIPALRALVGKSTRLKHWGYYEDRLTGPLATFALPVESQDLGTATLHYQTEPLGHPRTVEIHVDGQLVATLDIPATAPASGEIPLPMGARTLSLHTTNAARVNKADSRKLGIRLTQLEVRHALSEQIIDLLPAPRSTAS